MWAALKTAQFLIPAGIGALLGLAVGFGIGDQVGYWSGIDVGKQEERAAIQRQDDKAVEAGRDARSTVSGCYAGGGVWNQSTGKCDRR